MKKLGLVLVVVLFGLSSLTACKKQEAPKQEAPKVETGKVEGTAAPETAKVEGTAAPAAPGK